MTMTTERRNFLKAVSAAAASTAVLAGTQALAQGNLQAAAKAMPYQAKPMPFDPKTITGISEKVLVSHYENNYVGAVKRLNAIGTQLAELDFAKAPNFVINGLKREELVASNSMILHEIYFDGLGGGARASGPLADAIARDFGSMERWRSEFAAMGKAEGGGSGWVILAYSPRDKRLVNQWAADHTTTLAGGRPVLVLDMYEHASDNACSEQSSLLACSYISSTKTGRPPASVVVWSAAHWLTSRLSRGEYARITQPEPPPSALPIAANSDRQRSILPKSRAMASANGPLALPPPPSPSK